MNMDNISRTPSRRQAWVLSIILLAGLIAPALPLGVATSFDK